MSECNRCGKCCWEVGRTFWKNGGGDGQWDGIAELENAANDGDHEDGGLACEMLDFDGGVAVCMVELAYGKEAKPEVCVDHQCGEDD